MQCVGQSNSSLFCQIKTEILEMSGRRKKGHRVGQGGKKEKEKKYLLKSGQKENENFQEGHSWF